MAGHPWQTNRRPAWVRACNAAGRLLPAGRPTLDPDQLLERAARRTGLDDFGDPRFREPYGIFVDALEQEADLTPIGRFVAHHEVSTLLENRLQVEEAFRHSPEIEREDPGAPIFVTGTGRSGTSILHELLAQDPAHRVLETWEALHPCPPPERESYASDPRIRIADREAKLWDRIAPIYRTMHEGGGRVPQECIYLTALAFASDLLSGNYTVPSYAAWLGKADLTHAYQTHRRVLKLLQWKHERERWVLKAPSHLWCLEPLLAEYPRARIVITHRDPLAVMASMTSLMATLLWIRSDRVDPHAMGPRTVRSIAYMLNRATDLRDRGALPDAQVCDVRYARFLEDPIAAVASVYDHFGLTLSAEAESRMRRYLASRPQHRHGAHAWRFEDTGVDLEEARELFAPYRERYGVPAEL